MPKLTISPMHDDDACILSFNNNNKMCTEKLISSYILLPPRLVSHFG